MESFAETGNEKGAVAFEVKATARLAIQGCTYCLVPVLVTAASRSRPKHFSSPGTANQ